VLNLAGRHEDRYFLFEVDWGDEGDPWRPYGRVYDRVSRVLFPPVSFHRLNDLGDFFKPWTGPARDRIAIEREAAALE
jgi:hypothetical protein